MHAYQHLVSLVNHQRQLKSTHLHRLCFYRNNFALASVALIHRNCEVCSNGASTLVRTLQVWSDGRNTDLVLGSDCSFVDLYQWLGGPRLLLLFRAVEKPAHPKCPRRWWQPCSVMHPIRFRVNSAFVSTTVLHIGRLSSAAGTVVFTIATVGRIDDNKNSLGIVLQD